MSGKPDKSNGQPPAERTWTEAPASTTIRFALEGYDCMLTLRGESGADVLPKVQMAIEWLKKNHAEPTTRGNGNGRAGGAMPESKICPVHHVAMRLRHGKGGDSWYSHKAINPDTSQEYWCRGEQKQS